MTRLQRPVHVVGVGMIPFTKPGQSDPYTVMGARAARLALEDAGMPYELVGDVEQLGFSEASTFHRAFKKWTGVAPGEYRQRHR